MSNFKLNSTIIHEAKSINTFTNSPTIIEDLNTNSLVNLNVNDQVYLYWENNCLPIQELSKASCIFDQTNIHEYYRYFLKFYFFCEN